MTKLFNFKWKPTSSGIEFQTLGKYGHRQIVNHIEGHHALTNKDELYHNLQKWCEKNSKKIGDYLPLTFSLDFCSQVQDHDH